MKLTSLNRLESLALVLLFVAFLFCLLAYAYIGSFMRLSGDDYCYAGILGRDSFWMAQWNSYWKETTYNANRYSLTLLSGTADLFPPMVNGVLPGLMLLLWLVGLFYAITQIVKYLQLQAPFIFILLLAVFIEFITLVQAPDIAQSLYWRSGMLPYLAPLVGNTYLVGLIFGLAGNHRITPLVLAALFVFTFIVGGFSETGVMFQVGWLGLAIVLSWIDQLNRKVTTQKLRNGIFIALLATALALLGLAVSPIVQVQQGARTMPPKTDLAQLAGIIANFTYYFFAVTLKGQWVSGLIAALFPFLLSARWFSSRKLELNWSKSFRNGLLFLLFSSLICIGLVALISLPSAYVQQSGLELRAQILARYVVILFLIAVGLWLGRLLAAAVQRWSGRPQAVIQVVAMVILLASAIYPVVAGWEVYQSAPFYRKWAQFWDTRDQEIRSAQGLGEKDLVVVQIDHVIPRVADLSPDTDSWYNRCAAIYYHVDSIKASLPGWDN